MTKPAAVLAAAVAASAVACSGGGGPDVGASGVYVQISPAEAQVEAQGSVPFAAVVTGAATTDVEWSVSAGGGSIDASGLYTAPQALGTHYVHVRSVADPLAVATATVTVVGPAPACETTPPRTTGAVYYYCDCAAGAAAGCVPGSDANAGTSPSAPRRTLANAENRFNAMAAGGTVALCRGGAWTSGQLSIWNTSCRPTSESTWCDLRDYVPSWGSAASPRPRIDFGGSGALDVSTAGVQGIRVWNLDFRQTDNNQAGIFLYNGVHDLDFCNLRLEGSNLGFYPGSGTGTGVVLRNSQFFNHGFSAIYGGSDGLVIDSNYFENNGLNGSPQDHTIYLNGIDGGVTGARITNNEMRTDARCGGVMLVIHERVDDMVIENNLVFTTSTNPNCYGIQSAGSAAAAAFNRGSFRRNRVTTRGATALGIGCCRDCVVSDNVVVGGQLGVSDEPCNGTFFGSRVTVQNNSLYNATLRVGGEGDGYVVENNAVWTSGGSCMDVWAPTARQGNNFCRTSGGAAVGSVWVDAPNGNFKPVGTGPLAGAANPTSFSPLSIGSVTWSMTDRGQVRVAPADIGALQR